MVASCHLSAICILATVDEGRVASSSATTMWVSVLGLLDRADHENLWIWGCYRE